MGRFNNCSSLLVGGIVQPLLQLVQKVLFSYEEVYRPEGGVKPTMSSVWSVVGLLRRLVELGGPIEEMGRYYFKQAALPMICLIRVLNKDISVPTHPLRFSTHQSSYWLPLNRLISRS